MSRPLWIAIGSLCLATPSLAQRAPQPRTFPVDAFFADFFAEDSPEQRARVRKVPVSSREEREVGQRAFSAFRRQLQQRGVKLLDRGEDVQYVKALVRAIQPLLRQAKRYRTVQVYLADSDQIDARSFPGGTIVVFRGLIDFCETEAALVGILGHELSHFDRGHQLYPLKRWKLAQQSFQSGFQRQQFQDMAGFAKMFARPFRPEEESEADEDGLRWAVKLGYSPLPMAFLFQRLAQRQEAQGKPNRFMPRFLLSHPIPEDRARTLQQQGQQLQVQAPNARYLGRRNLRERQPRTEREFADERE